MATNTMDALSWLRKQLEEVDTDLLKKMVETFVETLMDAEVSAICGAGYKERSKMRENTRNGYRKRAWDTRCGSIELAIPKLRSGSYFPDWLIQPRRRTEKALVSVVAEAYLAGISTRRVDSLIKTLGIDGISKSQVSEMAKSLDSLVEDFRSRSLCRRYPYVWVDATAHKVREGGRVENTSTVMAIGVTEEGVREVMGCEVFTSEDEASWTEFLRSLRDRGLDAVSFFTSDAHQGLKQAISSVFPGSAWQRCRTHFMRNLLTPVPRSAQNLVATMVRTIFAQPDEASVRNQHAYIAEQLSSKFPEAANMLLDAKEEILAFASFPKEHWRQIWSNNPLERLNREIKRRTDVVGIFPNRSSCLRLVGAILAETNDEWLIARRYMSAESLKKLDGQLDDQSREEVIPALAEAS